MSKTEKQLKAELRQEIDTIKSLLRSLEDVKHGRVYPMKMHRQKSSS